MTDPERRRRVDELCDAALNREARERAAFVASACGGDEALRHEVEALLAHAQTAEGFLMAPLGAVAAHVLAEAHGASLVGRQIGSYTILSLLGAGGMGEVYRARDTKLGREVAIKVLPAAFTTDADRLTRLEREARLLAALNHPRIGAIYGLEEAGGVRALVLELVEGETLADRVARGRLPIAEALPIAQQIAEALEAAHEHGIIHRDLKPANIQFTGDGTVKVLDFGLAKAFVGHGSNPDVSRLPTVTVEGTREGIIAGTPAYMSPEQARGQPLDKRTDIWAFGCVLYEMLTGTRAFRGETVSEILADVMKSEPRWTALPPETPAALRNIVLRCLEKDPRQRVRDIGDVRLALEGAFETTVLQAAPPVRVPQWRRVAVASAVAVIAGAVLAGAAVWFAMRPAPPPTASLAITRFPLTLPEGQEFTNPNRRLVAISPDGTQMVYVANQRLYLRSMWELDARPIPGTEIGGAGVTTPVFSPDGRSIVFLSQADMTLKRIAVSGGAAVTICPADNPFGMSWGADGIVFGQGSKGVMRVSPTGGKPELLVSVKGDEVAHGPQMLPDGQTVLFTLATGTAADRWDKAHLVVQSLRSGERKTLIEGGSDARYLPTGHLVYALGGVVYGVPFDLTRLVVTGGPVAIVEGVRRAIAPTTGTAQFSVSDTGSLMYLPGPASAATSQSDLALIDRKGAVEPLKLPPGPYQFPRVSPNGKRVVFATDDGNEAIVWIYELAGASSMRRLTFGGKNRFPIWSADGERVAFQSDREGDLGIFWQRADGTGTAERLTKPDQGTGHVPESWSPKGERFLFGVTKGSNVSLWAFSLKDKKATPFGAVQSSVSIASVFSPDGRWVAYASTETGGNEIYMQPFPSTGAKYQISKNRGSVHPVWSPDGKELFYMPGAGEFGVVSVTTQPSVTLGNPVPVPRPFVFLSETAARNYDITPDGKRFVGVVAADQTQSGAPATRQIQVVLNWHEELKRLVPVR